MTIVGRAGLWRAAYQRLNQLQIRFWKLERPQITAGYPLHLLTEARLRFAVDLAAAEVQPHGSLRIRVFRHQDLVTNACADAELFDHLSLKACFM